MSDTFSSRGFGRVMTVLNTLARHGPLSLDEVSEQTAISRTACHRILKVLVESDCIRALMGSGKFILTSTFVRQLKAASHSDEAIDRVLPMIKQLVISKSVHFDFCVLDDEIVPKILETTRRKPLPHPQDFFENPFVPVILSIMPIPLRQRIITTAVEDQNDTSHNIANRQLLEQKIRSVAENGILDDDDNKCVIIPFKGTGNMYAGVRIGSSLTKQPRYDVISSIVDDLQSGKIMQFPTKSAIFAAHSDKN